MGDWGFEIRGIGTGEVFWIFYKGVPLLPLLFFALDWEGSVSPSLPFPEGRRLQDPRSIRSTRPISRPGPAWPDLTPRENRHDARITGDKIPDYSNSNVAARRFRQVHGTALALAPDHVVTLGFPSRKGTFSGTLPRPGTRFPLASVLYRNRVIPPLLRLARPTLPSRGFFPFGTSTTRVCFRYRPIFRSHRTAPYFHRLQPGELHALLRH